jgi:hypothetical protein
MHLSPLPQLPRPGQTVRWRDPRHARALGWEEAYGPGPFEVVGATDNSHLGIPRGVILKTDLGQREVNEVWLAIDESRWEEADGLGEREVSLIDFGAL